MNLFDIIPDSFFSLLSSKNKKIYVSLLLEAFKIYEAGSIIGINKKIVCDELIHYLDNNTLNYENEDLNDEEADVKSKRDLANYCLRRFEECGWIYIDVTNDYEEILNFSDYGITMCEALLEIMPSNYYNDDYYEDNSESIRQVEYHGYIYTIYSLLNNTQNIDYSYIISEVIRNSRLLLRSIRKLDSRLKTYISSVFENADVKDLMENLISYRTDFYDNGYAKLKMGDNINRYRLHIVTKLEEYQQDMNILNSVASLYSNLNYNKALERANSNIDELIDLFNSLDSYISEIDDKSKTYINSTIAKIKFLVSEDDNIIGKLNRILKYLKDENKNNHLEKALKEVNEYLHLKSFKQLSEASLYFPRGGYKRNFNLLLDNSRLNELELESDFINSYKTPYNETDILIFINDNLKDNQIYASDIINNETDIDTSMLLIYAILYVLENEETYDFDILDNIIFNKYLKLRNFVIRKKV